MDDIKNEKRLSVLKVYDKKDVITKEQALRVMNYYSVKIVNNKYEVSLIDGLNMLHFKDTLYKDVIKGSKRYWVLERRKFDYNVFHSRSNHRIVKYSTIENHESVWKDKVNNFYSELLEGYVDSKTIESDKKVPSKYMLEKYFDNVTLSKDELYNLGLDKNKKPINYCLKYDSSDYLSVVECKVDFEVVKNKYNYEPFSAKWWQVQRMRFDFGMKDYPLLEGQIKDDMKGVEYRFNYLYHNQDVDFIQLHQEAWIRYVDALFNWKKKDHKTETLSIDDKRKHNIYVVNAFTEEKIDVMIKNHSYVVLDLLPNSMIQSYLNTIIDDALYNDRIRVKLFDACINDVINPLKTMISKFKYSQKEGCKRFDLTTCRRLMVNHKNDYMGMIKYLISKAIANEMVDVRYVQCLIDSTNKFKIEDVYEKNTRDSLMSQLDFFNVQKEVLDSAWDMCDDKTYCEENGLYYY